MYQDFKRSAVMEGNHIAEEEMQSQIAESQEHAEQFSQILKKAEKLLVFYSILMKSEIISTSYLMINQVN